jgi:hypothetical protein
MWYLFCMKPVKPVRETYAETTRNALRGIAIAAPDGRRS